MLKKVEQQELDELKMEFAATERAISRLTQKREQLEKQITRLNLAQQIQNHGVARITPGWIVNGRNKLEVNSSPR